jgi:hypothetical protein
MAAATNTSRVHGRSLALAAPETVYLSDATVAGTLPAPARAVRDLKAVVGRQNQNRATPANRMPLVG